MGRCGKTLREAALTPYLEYLLLVDGKVEEMHQNWEIARWMAWQQVLLSPDIKPAQKPHTPKAFMTFPWEKPDAGEIERMKEDSVVTESEAIELTKIFADYHLKNKENN